MWIQLTKTLDPDFGLVAGTQLEVFDGPGSENNTQVAGVPNGNKWIICPKVPPVRNRAGESVGWKTLYQVVRPGEYVILQ